MKYYKRVINGNAYAAPEGACASCSRCRGFRTDADGTPVQALCRHDKGIRSSPGEPCLRYRLAKTLEVIPPDEVFEEHGEEDGADA